MGIIVIYSTLGCGYCAKAKDLLLRLQVPYTEIDLYSHPSQWSVMVNRAGGKKTVPQIFFNNEHIGVRANLYLSSNSAKYSSCDNLFYD
jgi:glutaredoxin 3